MIRFLVLFNDVFNQVGLKVYTGKRYLGRINGDSNRL